MELKPTHLVRDPSDDLTLCGLHWRRDERRAYPQMWMRFVETRRLSYLAVGRELVLCEDCELRAEQLVRTDA